MKFPSAPGVSKSLRPQIAVVFLATAVLLSRGLVAAAVPQVAIVIQPVTITIKYGHTVIPAGTRLPVSAADGSTVTVEYLGETQKLPLVAVRLEDVPAIATPTAAPQLSKNPASPPAPEPPRTETITLQPGWDGHMQGGDVTMHELQEVLSHHCAAGTDLGGGTPELYRGVRYLMPAATAAQVLGLSHRVRSGERIVAAGFPRNSLSCSTFDGSFEGQFNRLELVSDAADRVVCLQLVNQTPHRDNGSGDKDRWMTYNFIRNAMRASDTMRVSLNANRNGEVITLETRLFQRFGRQHGDHFHLDHLELKEKNRLILPIQFARLILHCIEGGLRK